VSETHYSNTSVCIKYSMRDLVCDANPGQNPQSCDMGQISVNDVSASSDISSP